jgi:hypothetical protein
LCVAVHGGVRQWLKSATAAPPACNAFIHT